MIKGFKAIPECYWLDLVRVWVYDGTGMSSNTVKRILLSMESKEGVWLQNKLKDMPEFNGNVEDKWRWFVEVMSREDNMYANYYHATALDMCNNIHFLKRHTQTSFTLFMKSALEGFSLAMEDVNAYGNDTFPQSSCETVNINPMATISNGCIHCLNYLVKRKLLPTVQLARFDGLLLLLSGDREFYHGKHSKLEQFVAGREVDGYEELWSDRHLYCEPFYCNRYYHIVTNCARRSALQTVVILRSKGVVPDVARLIGRLVYQTREIEPHFFAE